MLKITLLLSLLCIGFVLPSPVKRNAATIIEEKLPEAFTLDDLAGIKQELKRELLGTGIENTGQLIGKFASNDTNREDALAVLMKLLFLALPDEVLRTSMNLGNYTTYSSKDDVHVQSTNCDTQISTKSSAEFTNEDIEKLRSGLTKVMDKKDADNLADLFNKITNNATTDKTADGVIQLFVIALAIKDNAGKENAPKSQINSTEVKDIHI